MHFEVGNLSGRAKMGSQLANLAAVRPVCLRGQKVDFFGQKSKIFPGSRKVKNGSGGPYWVSKSVSDLGPSSPVPDLKMHAGMLLDA